MPFASPSVTFAHAKDWAKRLKKASPAFEKLSQAQEAVAKMLGHASWHALTAFYENQTPPAVPSPVDPSHPFADVLELVNAKFPGVNAVDLRVLGYEADEINTDPHALADRILYLDREGYLPEYAAKTVLEEMTCTVHAPPGFIMAGVLDANGKAFQVLLETKDYHSATKRKRRDASSPK